MPDKDPHKTISRIAFLAVLIFLLGTIIAIAIQSWATFGIAFFLALLTASTIILNIPEL